MKAITFQISDEAFELLKSIKERPAEYRDTRYETLKDFKESNEFTSDMRNEEWFLRRNNGGTLYLINELEYCGLVECDGESWHITYVLTPFGKKILDKV